MFLIIFFGRGTGGVSNGENDGGSAQGVAGGGEGTPAHGGEGDPFDIGNRRVVHAPREVNTCGRSGTVKVVIVVNRNGEVVSALQAGGTTANRCLISTALKQAKGLRYASSNTFNEGEITFRFKIN